MNIYIFGANGMLGNYVKNYFNIINNKQFNIIPFTRNEYNLDDLRILDNLKFNKDDIIINCVGAIPQRTNDFYKINTVFPILLSHICDKYQAKMIHITTDYVFSGKDGNYNELSNHDSDSDYGKSKSLSELCNATIIRASIIGEELYNKKSLLEWVKNNRGNEINGYINHYWNGVTCLELSKIIYKIIEKQLFWLGVRNVFSPRNISKYELVCIINNIYSCNIKINKFKTESFDKTLTTIYPLMFEIPDIEEQIKELFLFSCNLK